MGQMTQPTVL